MFFFAYKEILFKSRKNEALTKFSFFTAALCVCVIVSTDSDIIFAANVIVMMLFAVRAFRGKKPLFILSFLLCVLASLNQIGFTLTSADGRPALARRSAPEYLESSINGEYILLAVQTKSEDWEYTEFYVEEQKVFFTKRFEIREEEIESYGFPKIN